MRLRLLSQLLLSFLFMAMIGSILIAQGRARDPFNIRFAQLSPDAEDIAIFLNDIRIRGRDVAFGEITSWRQFPAQPYNIRVTVGSDEAEYETRFEPEADDRVTFVLVGGGDDRMLQRIQEDYSDLPTGESRLTIFQAIEDAPPLDVYVDDALFFPGLEYHGEDEAGLLLVDVIANTYELHLNEINEQDETLVDLGELNLQADRNYLVALYNTIDEPKSVTVVTSLETGEEVEQDNSQPDDGLAEALLRVAHLSSGTPTLDVYINGRLRDTDSLRFPEFSPWIPLPADTYSISATVAGESLENPLLGPFEVDLEAGTFTNVVIIGLLANNSLESHVIQEEFGPVNPGTVRLSVLNAHPGVGPISIIQEDGTELVQLLGYPGFFGNNDGFAWFTLNSGTQTLQIITDNDEEVLIELTDQFFFPGRNYFLSIVSADPPFWLEFSDIDEINTLIE